MAATTKIREVRDELQHHLREVAGVGAVGIAWTPSGERCLRVSVAPGFAERDKIPAHFHGVPVTVQTAEDAHLSTK